MQSPRAVHEGSAALVAGRGGNTVVAGGRNSPLHPPRTSPAPQVRPLEAAARLDPLPWEEAGRKPRDVWRSQASHN